MNQAVIKNGTVYLVGAGPGDPGLITVRASELLKNADVLVYDNLIPSELLQQAREDAQLIYVGKSHGKHTLPQEQINAVLIEHAQLEYSVVRLKGGDPFVFGRGGEEALALAEACIPFEIVPGVTAAVAAAAYAGIPITHREVASSACLITGHESPDKNGSDLDYGVLAKRRATLAFYMGLRNMERICGNLIRHGLDPEMPAAAVQWGTTSKQKVVTGTVETLPGICYEAKLESPTVFLIGEVVSLQEHLHWFNPDQNPDG